MPQAYYPGISVLDYFYIVFINVIFFLVWGGCKKAGKIFINMNRIVP